MTLQEACRKAAAEFSAAGIPDPAWDSGLMMERVTGVAPLLARLVAAAGGRPQILVGAGVSAAVIRDLQPKTGADAFHLSAKRTLASGMAFRRQDVPMGLPGMDEFTIWRCDGDAVRQARAALDALCPA